MAGTGRIRRLLVLPPLLASLAASAGATEWIDYGARSLAMGGTGVALSQGPLSVYMNPAGLGEWDSPSGFSLPVNGHIAFSGSAVQGANDLFQVTQDCKNGSPNCTPANINSALAAFGSPGTGLRADLGGGLNFKFSKLAFFVNNFAYVAGLPVADLVNTTPGAIANNTSHLNLRGLNATEIGTGFGHELPFAPGVYLGANAKAIVGQVGYYDVSVVNNNVGTTGGLDNFVKSVKQSVEPAVDAGVLWDVNRTWSWVPFRPRLGVTGRNLNNPRFTQPDQAIAAGLDDKFTLERNVRAGLAISPLHFWNITADLDLTKNHTELSGLDSRMIGVGTEINVFNRTWLNIPLRVGLQKNLELDSAKPQITGGLGLNFLHLVLDAGAAVSPATQTLQSQGKSTKFPSELSGGIQLSLLFGGGSEKERENAAPKPAPPDPKQKKYAAWRKEMAGRHPKKPGCYTATYPSRTFKPVACGHASGKLHGPGADVGQAIAQASPDHIWSATGRFANLTNVSSVQDRLGCTGGPFGAIGEYSLQINANTPLPVLAPALKLPNGEHPCAFPGNCQALVQFVYANNGVGQMGNAHIEYWLIGFFANYNACPVNLIDPGGSKAEDRYFVQKTSNCVLDTNPVDVPSGVDLTDFPNIEFNGTTEGPIDDVSIGSTTIYLKTVESSVGLSKAWTAAEFNVFGEGNGSCAIFNSGATLTVVQTLAGYQNTPIQVACSSGTFTQERNTLNTTCPCFANGGTLFFTESSAPDPTCACPAGAAWDSNSKSCGCQSSQQTMDPTTGICSCPIKGETLVKGYCSCPKGQSVIGGTCGCPQGTVYNASLGQCLAPPPKCPSTCKYGCGTPYVDANGSPHVNCNPGPGPNPGKVPVPSGEKEISP